MLPLFDLATSAGREAFAACLKKLRNTTSVTSDVADTVKQIVSDVQREGDDAVVRYMRRWSDPAFDRDRIQVGRDELARAERSLEAPLRDALTRAIDHVRAYQSHFKPTDPASITIDRAELGLRFTPVDSVGLTIPGGAAPLFSTLIMLAVPAQVAGVQNSRIAVVHPPPDCKPNQRPKDVSSLTLATCALLGLDRVYRIGGAQAVAALAFGTESVEPVEMIAGPGNIYGQLAKQQVSGIVGSDGGFYGPSEIATIADESADPAAVAADLVAQAEHDPGKCFVIGWSRRVLTAIVDQIALQLPARRRRVAIESALEQESCAVLVADSAEAVDVANTIACEHVNLAVADPDAFPIRHAGEIFFGSATPVAAGDYYAGPSHCLPTGSTARFASGISVYTFLKRTGTVRYRDGMSQQAMDAVACLAEAEGLDGHAHSIRVREGE